MTLYENDACFASKPGQAVKDLESIRQSFQSFIDMGVKLEAKHKLIMKVSQDEQKQENDNVNILAKESSLLFNNMLSECGQNKDYIRAVSSKGEYYSAESLFMVLVLQQQEMINELIVTD
jgi:hypothetical protein